jgi:hypothetical protein
MLSLGIGYLKPYVKGVEVKDRAGVAFGYQARVAPDWSLGIAMEGGVQTYNCTTCTTPAEATESITAFVLLGNYWPSRMPGLYVGPRLGTATIRSQIPIQLATTPPSTTLQVQEGSDPFLGFQTGYSKRVAHALALGGELSYSYIFSDDTAWLLNVVATAAWVF